MYSNSILKVFLVVLYLVFLVISCGKTQTEEELMSAADVALKEGKPNIALKAYKDIVRLHPDSPDRGRVQVLIGIIYLDQYNDEEKMKQAWDEVKKVDSDFDLERGLYDQAQELQNHGNPQLAAKIYEKIIELFPDSPIRYQAQFLTGFVYSEQLKDYDKAKEAFQRVIDQFPDCDLVDDARFMLETMGSDSLAPVFEE
jgi:outer membrane protein assembly factor BamD (BamD/ComL family)